MTFWRPIFSRSFRISFGEQVIVPVTQGVVIGGAASYAAALVFEVMKWAPPYTLPLALGVSAGVLWAAYRFDKTSPEAQVKAAAEVERPRRYSQNVTVWINAPEQGIGGAIRFIPSPVALNKLRQIGFHVTYLGGRISHPYLVRDHHILCRREAEDLQELLLHRKMARWRNESSKKGGVVLEDVGVIYFWGLAREYSPSPIEKAALKFHVRSYRLAYIHTNTDLVAQIVNDASQDAQGARA